MVSGEKSRGLVDAVAASGDDPARAADSRRSAVEAPETGLAAGGSSTWWTTIEDLGVYSEPREMTPLVMIVSSRNTDGTNENLQVGESALYDTVPP